MKKLLTPIRNSPNIRTVMPIRSLSDRLRLKEFSKSEAKIYVKNSMFPSTKIRKMNSPNEYFLNSSEIL